MDKKGNNSVFLTKNDQKEQKMTKNAQKAQKNDQKSAF